MGLYIASSHFETKIIYTLYAKNHLISFLPIVISVVVCKKQNKKRLKCQKITDTGNKDDGRNVITIPNTYF